MDIFYSGVSITCGETLRKDSKTQARKNWAIREVNLQRLFGGRLRTAWVRRTFGSSDLRARTEMPLWILSGRSTPRTAVTATPRDLLGKEAITWLASKFQLRGLVMLCRDGTGFTCSGHLRELR